MIWIFTVLGEIMFGIEITLFLITNKADFYVLCSIGTIVGIGISTLIFFGCSFFLGMTSFHLLVHTIGISLAAYSLLMRRIIKKLFTFSKPSKAHCIFGLTSLLLAIFLIPSAYLSRDFTFLETISNDISEEISLTNSFYQGVNSGLLNIFKIRHPSCYQCVARSRWITPLNSAMLLFGYSSPHYALSIPSILMTFSFCFVFLNLANSFLKSVFCSLLVLLVFFFAGGYGFASLLYKKVRKQTNLDFIHNNGLDETNWYHPVLHYYLSSRPSQLSLCIVVSIFYLLSCFYYQNSKTSKKRQMILIGFLFGLLPGNQFQVFIAFFVYLIIFFLLTFPFNVQKRRKDRFAEFLLFGISFILISFLQFLQFIVPRSTNANILVKSPITLPLIKKGSNFPTIQFWYEALGLFPLFTLVISWFLMDKELMKFYFPSVVIFLWANSTLFQQIDRMNLTVFYPCWMIFATIAFVDTLRRLVLFLTPNEEIQGFLFGLSVFLVLGSVASGTYGMYKLRDKKVTKWDKNWENAAKWISQNTPKKAVFISTMENFDVVSTLSGKVQFFHSTDLCKLYGFDKLNRTDEIEDLLNDPGSEKAASKVEYFVTIDQIPERPLNHWGKGNWTKEYSNGGVSVFKRNLVRQKKKKL